MNLGKWWGMKMEVTSLGVRVRHRELSWAEIQAWRWSAWRCVIALGQGERKSRQTGEWAHRNAASRCLGLLCMDGPGLRKTGKAGGQGWP